MYVLEANIFGRLVPVYEVTDYGDDADFFPGNYAWVTLDHKGGPSAKCPTDMLFIRKLSMGERLDLEYREMVSKCDTCRECAPLKCDKHA